MSDSNSQARRPGVHHSPLAPLRACFRRPARSSMTFWASREDTFLSSEKRSTRVGPSAKQVTYTWSAEGDRGVGSLVGWLHMRGGQAGARQQALGEPPWVRAARRQRWQNTTSSPKLRLPHLLAELLCQQGHQLLLDVLVGHARLHTAQQGTACRCQQQCGALEGPRGASHMRTRRLAHAGNDARPAPR